MFHFSDSKYDVIKKVGSYASTHHKGKYVGGINKLNPKKQGRIWNEGGGKFAGFGQIIYPWPTHASRFVTSWTSCNESCRKKMARFITSRFEVTSRADEVTNRAYEVLLCL